MQAIQHIPRVVVHAGMQVPSHIGHNTVDIKIDFDHEDGHMHTPCLDPIWVTRKKKVDEIGTQVYHGVGTRSVGQGGFFSESG